jgi:hypothetical protein
MKDLGNIGFGSEIEISIPFVVPYPGFEDVNGTWIDVMHTTSHIVFHVHLPHQKPLPQHQSTLNSHEINGFMSSVKAGDFSFEPSHRMNKILKGDVKERVRESIQRAAERIQKEYIPLTMQLTAHPIIKTIREELAKEFSEDISQYNLADLEGRGYDLKDYANQSGIKALVDPKEIQKNIVDPLLLYNQATKISKSG